MAKQTPVSDKALRREEARQKALKLQQEQLKREKRSRLIVLGSILLGAVLLGALIFYILSKAPSDIADGITEFPDDVAVPTTPADNDLVTFGEDGGIAFAAPDADPDTTPVLDVYLDFMCPACASFEGANASFIEQAIADGEIIYRAHPVSILNSQHSQTIGSTFVALAQDSPEHALDFVAEAFARQNNAGLSAAQMQEIAESVGVETSVAKEAVSGKFERYIVASTKIGQSKPELRNESGGFGTPSLFINGERSEVNWAEPGVLAATVAEVAETMAQ